MKAPPLRITYVYTQLRNTRAMEFDWGNKTVDQACNEMLARGHYNRTIHFPVQDMPLMVIGNSGFVN